MTPTTTHTPGPWLVETDQTPDGSSLYVIDRDGQRIVADCDGGATGQESVETAEANARLIAAAPDLLAALKDLVETCERIGAPAITQGGLCEETDWHYDIKKAKAAIARAEGETI